MDIIKQAKNKASNINLKALEKAGVKRDLKKYYILGNYPPLIVLDDVLTNKINIFNESKDDKAIKELDIYLHFPFLRREVAKNH